MDEITLTVRDENGINLGTVGRSDEDPRVIVFWPRNPTRHAEMDAADVLAHLSEEDAKTVLAVFDRLKAAGTAGTAWATTPAGVSYKDVTGRSGYTWHLSVIPAGDGTFSATAVSGKGYPSHGFFVDLRNAQDWCESQAAR